MNKKEFIDAIQSKDFEIAIKKREGMLSPSTHRDFTKGEIERVLDAAINVIMDTVADGDSVQLVGFGTFTHSERVERNGHNPKTKEKIVIAACKTPKFKAGKLFKDALNK